MGWLDWQEPQEVPLARHVGSLEGTFVAAIAGLAGVLILGNAWTDLPSALALASFIYVCSPCE